MPASIRNILAVATTTLIGLTGCELPNDTVPRSGGHTPSGSAHHKPFSKAGNGFYWCPQFSSNGETLIDPASGYPVVTAGKCNPRSKLISKPT